MAAYVVYWAHLEEHTDPKTQGYIGITKDFDTRKTRHVSDAEARNSKCIHFANAIRKYGKDTIVFDILIDGIDKELAELIEQEYRPDRGIGWNLCIGGGVNIRTGTDHQYYGKNRSKATIDKIKETCSRKNHSKGTNNPNYDYTVYSLYHPEHGIENLTKHEFNTKYGFHLKPLFRTKNPSKIRKGWRLL